MVGRFVGCNECYGAASTPADRTVAPRDMAHHFEGGRARGPAERPSGHRTTESRSSARRATKRFDRDLGAVPRMGERIEAHQGSNGPAHARRRGVNGASTVPLPRTDNLPCSVVRGITR